MKPSEAEPEEWPLSTALCKVFIHTLTYFRPLFSQLTLRHCI